ncbi:MAG TPA: type II toxin-antitoxin system VapC family toxin [Gemmataceae bacterium]|jgi:predicted nucleic acid-binding protein
MIFGDIPTGVAVFLDANVFVYHFTMHPQFSAAATALLERIENRDIHGVTSASVLADVSHRLMTLEAHDLLGWPMQGIAHRLKRHPNEVQKLTRYRQALDEISQLGMQIVPVTGPFVSLAADVSRQHGLLCNDALIITVMRDQGLQFLASHDADFDRIPGIVRYAPA